MINKDATREFDYLNFSVESVANNISQYVKKQGDFTRNRKLNAKTTIMTILGMQSGNLNKNLREAFPSLDNRPTASAFEQAKDKLTSKVFIDLFNKYNATKENFRLYKDKYLVYAVDGSDFTFPYNAKSKYRVAKPSGRPRKDGTPTKSYCQLHANILFDLENRIYEDFEFQARENVDERTAMLEMVKRLDKSYPYIVIADRGYESFNVFETLRRTQNCFFVIRVKEKSGIKEIDMLPNAEVDTEIIFKITTNQIKYKEDKSLHLIQIPKKKASISKTSRCKRWDFEDDCEIPLRVVKFKISREGEDDAWEVLITNLNRFEFKLNEMKDMYFKRWGIETSFRDLKYSVGAITFNSKKDEFVEMELISKLIFFNFSSRAVQCVNIPKSERKYTYQVNFSAAVDILRRYYIERIKPPPEKLLRELSSYLSPIREGRKDKRKLRPKSAIWFCYRIA